MKWFGASANPATDRRLLQKAAKVGILVVVSLSLLGLPATSSPVDASNFSDNIAAARARQNDLKQGIARQNRLLDDLKSDAAVARKALTKTCARLDGINADQAQVRRDIDEATTALAKVQARRQDLQGQLQQLDRTLEVLEQEIDQGAAELDARREALGARLADAYRTQNTSLLAQVIDSGSFTDVLSDASAYLAYGDQDAELARDIERDQAALDSLRAVTAATRYRTDQLRRAAQDAAADLRAQKAVLAKAKAKLIRLEQKTKKLQRQQLAQARKIAANRREARAYVRRHQQAERKLDRKIAGLVRAAKRAAARNSGGGSSGGGSGNGRFAWPTSGTVTQEFGCTGFYLEPRRGSCAHFHDGVDIANGSGTPIHAAGAGVVAFVGWNPYDGGRPAYVVVIGHAGGFSTFYSHLLPRRVVGAGQRVRRGQLIGYMGATGNATGPHLHFELKRGETPVNPRAYT